MEGKLGPPAEWSAEMCGHMKSVPTVGLCESLIKAGVKWVILLGYGSKFKLHIKNTNNYSKLVDAIDANYINAKDIDIDGEFSPRLVSTYLMLTVNPLTSQHFD